MPGNSFFLDKESENRWILHRVKRHLFSKKTKFQQVEYIETYGLGHVLILDNKIQSAESDEYIYHEALVHPAMIAHPNPANVLVLGGGEGATLREVLKHPSVKNAVMVDIDKELVEFCKKYMKKWHSGAFLDKRVRVLYQDALAYMKKIKTRFDVIVADINDPLEAGPAALIYTREFYQDVFNALTDNGIIVTQATEVYYSQPEIHSIINKTIASVFPIAESYCEYIPSFSSMWGFVAGSKKISLKGLNQTEITKRIKDRKLKSLGYYNEETHARLFNIPPIVKRQIMLQKKTATKDNPILVFSEP